MINAWNGLSSGRNGVVGGNHENFLKNRQKVLVNKIFFVHLQTQTKHGSLGSLAQLVQWFRASALQAEGRGFDSLSSHKEKQLQRCSCFFRVWFCGWNALVRCTMGCLLVWAGRHWWRVARQRTCAQHLSENRWLIIIYIQTPRTMRHVESDWAVPKKLDKGQKQW